MIEGLLEDDDVSVSRFISLNYHSATGLGSKVEIESRIKELSSKAYSFSLVVRSNDDIIAIGEHKRKIIKKKSL